MKKTILLVLILCFSVNCSSIYLPPLYYAIESGSADCVRLVLEQGANPNKLFIQMRGTDSTAPVTKFSALAFAIEKRNIKMVRTLLEAGACPDIGITQDRYYDIFPLVMAKWIQDDELINVLLAAGADTQCAASSYNHFTLFPQVLTQQIRYMDPKVNISCNDAYDDSV